MPIQRSFLKCAGGSLGSDSLAFEEVHIQDKQIEEMMDGEPEGIQPIVV